MSLRASDRRWVKVIVISGTMNSHPFPLTEKLMKMLRWFRGVALLVCSLVMAACVTAPPVPSTSTRPAKIAVVLGAGAAKDLPTLAC